MRVLLFSDLHAHNFKNYAVTLENGRNSRLQHALDILTEIRTQAEMHQCSGVLFGGDLFHIRPNIGSMSIPTFNAVFEAIALLKVNLDFVGLLVGNHDQGDRAGKEHSIYAFNSIVTVMDKPDWYSFKSGDEILDVFALPASSNKELLLTSLQKGIQTGPISKDPSAKQLLLGHLGISGAAAGTNYILKDDQNLNILDLRPDCFDQVFLGDFHKPQQLSRNAYYIGATHHHNWRDVDQYRGYLVYSTETNSISRFECTSAPKFISVPYETLQENGITSEYSNCYIRIVTDKKLHQSVIDEWIEKFSHTDVLNVPEFHLNLEHVELEQVCTGDFQPTLSQKDMVVSYVQQELPDSLDEDYLCTIGTDLIEEALARYEE